MLVQCPNCGESASAQPFCDNCGTSLDRICPACNAANRPAARFCGTCGKGLASSPASVAAPLPAQHKQVTILFADICGSTEIVANLDAEDASLALGAVLQVISSAVRRFGGVITHRMGDGVMVLFGAPIATEDHAAQACFAALAILADVGQMAERGLPVRIGVCSGPVVLRRIGQDEDDYEVAGVTAHIAARLEQNAEPGTILLAPQTLQLVVGIAQTELIGPMTLKGLAEPLLTYRLVSARDQSSWTVRSSKRALSPFIGRSEELAQLAAALQAAYGGQSQAVALVGDAGMGKSRLLHEFLDALPAGDWHIIVAETTAQTMAVPYVLLTAILRHIVGYTSGETLAEIAARLPAALEALRLEAAADLSPLLLHLDQQEGLSLAASTPAIHRNNLVQTLTPIFQRYSEALPLILVVEDFQWLDASSVELLDALRHELTTVRLLLLLTARPERRPNWDAAGGAAHEIELTPLTASQSDRMLSDLVGSGAELATLRTLVIARAGGTPFFLEELAQSLQEQGALAEDERHLADIVIPASIQGILAARIDRLSPLHRRILQVAAVVGQDVPVALLAAVTDLSAGAMADALHVLRAARFLDGLGGPGGGMHSFSHALTQAVAYDTLLRSDRRTLHERVLRALEAMSPVQLESTVDERVHHAVCAEAWPEAARYAIAAAERASSRSAPKEAKAYLQAAIAALDRQPTTLATLSQAIDARLSLRGVSASLTDSVGMQEMLQATLAEADHLAEQAGDRLALARVYVSRGAMLSHWGDLSGAIELSRSAIGIMRAGDDKPGLVGAAFALVQALWYAGDLAGAQAVLAANIDLARSSEGQQRSSATFVLPAVGFLCYQARIQAQLRDHAASQVTIDEARVLATRVGSVFDETLVDLNEGAAWLEAGETDRAVEILEHTLCIARRHSNEWHIPSIACLLGAGWVEMGRNVEARHLLEQASAFADRNRHVAKRLLCGPPLIRALAGAPHHDIAAARALAERTLQDAEWRGFRPIVEQTRAALAMVEALQPGAQPVPV